MPASLNEARLVSEKPGAFGVLGDGEALATVPVNEGTVRREVPGQRPWSCESLSPKAWRLKAKDTADTLRAKVGTTPTWRRQGESALDAMVANFVEGRKHWGITPKLTGGAAEQRRPC